MAKSNALINATKSSKPNPIYLIHFIFMIYVVIGQVLNF
jgi:hypothetical protein